MPKKNGRDALPEGVVVRPLTAHADTRGTVTEVFRQSWNEGDRAVQWNMAHSHARTMRGVHVHARHTDYLVVIAGTLLLGLHDLRETGTGASCTLTLDAAAPHAVLIPPGVCHGFYFAVPGAMLYGLSEYWEAHEELGCRFDAPELGLDWPDLSPELSPRDRNATSYTEMRAQYLHASQRPGANPSAHRTHESKEMT